mmetsp:Transcript_87743/g.200536  ORF Transcript_87743/g.200536 Transcript_87743/m.200536 type:complete len:210 (-) Transcript_87743:739-1368(-)
MQTYTPPSLPVHVVAHQLEIAQLKIPDALPITQNLQHRIRLRHGAECLLQALPAHERGPDFVDQLARNTPAHLGNQTGQQGVRRHTLGHPISQIALPLVQKTRQRILLLVHVELAEHTAGGVGDALELGGVPQREDNSPVAGVVSDSRNHLSQLVHPLTRVVYPRPRIPRPVVPQVKGLRRPVRLRLRRLIHRGRLAPADQLQYPGGNS